MPLETCLSERDLVQIVGRARTLAERLQGESTPTPQFQPAAAKRLERWRRLSANDDPAAFQRILASHGLFGVSESRLLARLSDEPLTPASPTPAWAILLRQISQVLSASFRVGDNSRPSLPWKATRSIPYGHLFSPVAVLARRQVEALVPLPGRWLQAEAWHGLQRHLVSRISAICSLALQPKFLAFKAVCQPGPAFAFFDAPPTNTARLPVPAYRAFVHEQGGEGLRDFFLEYPVAARLTAQVTWSWIEFIGEFLRRFDADAEAISRHFFAGCPVEKISAARAGLSDPHRSGRSVLILHFTSGRRLLYKPRPLEIDAAFFDLLASVSGEIGEGRPPVPDVLVRTGYGWESYVAHASCANRREGHRFYRRAGALLALVHELRGMDFHCENLIAAGGHPIPVDLEALGHPSLPEPIPANDRQKGDPLLDSSILRTGLLPVRGSRFDEGGSPDYSALGAPARQSSATEGVRWRYVNSTRMEAFWGRSRYACATHLPRLHGRPLSARDHVAEVLAGYRKAAQLLHSETASARERRARMTAIQRLAGRVIHRPTQVYLMLIRCSLQPHLLTDGVDRSIALQALPAASADVATRRAEIEALEMLDVPCFTRESAAPPGRASDERNLEQEVATIRQALKMPVRRRLPARNPPDHAKG